ncbi:hypothetical protein B0H11DRAFT_1910261 [Mycena galericulata]|nr:hypothetical protein B0H11DRAFT_1910261 [Mycena galericulata]
MPGRRGAPLVAAPFAEGAWVCPGARVRDGRGGGAVSGSGGRCRGREARGWQGGGEAGEGDVEGGDGRNALEDGGRGAREAGEWDVKVQGGDAQRVLDVLIDRELEEAATEVKEFGCASFTTSLHSSHVTVRMRSLCSGFDGGTRDVLDALAAESHTRDAAATAFARYEESIGVQGVGGSDDDEESGWWERGTDGESSARGVLLAERGMCPREPDMGVGVSGDHVRTGPEGAGCRTDRSLLYTSNTGVPFDGRGGPGGGGGGTRAERDEALFKLCVEGTLATVVDTLTADNTKVNARTAYHVPQQKREGFTSKEMG